MQYKSFTIRKVTVFSLLLAMVAMPSMGLCQNTPQKATKVDTVRQKTTTNAVLSQRSVATSTSNAVAIPTMLTYNDTALQSIQDTLNLIAKNARWRFLWAESTKSNSWVGFAAMIVGILAAIFAGLGFKYQRRASKTLNRMEPKRLPYEYFSKVIYDNLLTLDILREIELTNLSEKIKQERRKYYHVRETLLGMKMPDDIIDLGCYEHYQNAQVYYSAINIIISWRKNNSMIEDLIHIFDDKGEIDIKSYDKLKKINVGLFEELSAFEELIIKEDAIKKESENKQEVMDEHDDTYQSKNKFVLNRLIKFFNHNSKLIDYTLYDPKYAIYGTEKLRWSFVFPADVNEILDRNITFKELPFQKIKKLLGMRLFDESNIKSRLNFDSKLIDIRTTQWSTDERNFLFDIYFSEPSSLVDTLMYKIDDFDYSIYKKWFCAFCNDVFEGTGVNNIIGSWLVYSWDMMQKRAEILNEDKTSYCKERDLFTRERKRYSEFGNFFMGKDDENWSIRRFLYAIVAEQSLRIFEENYDVEYETDESDEESFALEIIPFLKLVRIIDEDGNIMIRTLSELNQAISFIPQEILDNDDWELLNEYVRKSKNGADIFTVHDDSVLSVNGEVHYFDKKS